MKNMLCNAVSTYQSHPIMSFLATLGAVAVADKVFYVIKGAWKYVVRPSKDLAKLYKTEKAWAIVTGGSSGIGFAYAKHLARAGFNIILIARNARNLEVKKDEILDELGPKAPEIKTFPFDFSKNFSLNYYQQLEMFIVDKEIAILVNNIGVDDARKFAEVPIDNLLNMLNVNVISLTYLTRIVVPAMLKRSKRSAIINISSTFTTTYVPYYSLYTATKTYMNSLMQYLHKELKDKIDVLTCLTGEVSTPRNLLKSIWHTTADLIAKEQISALGYDAITSGTLRHAFYKMYLKSFASFWFKQWISKVNEERTIKERASMNIST